MFGDIFINDEKEIFQKPENMSSYLDLPPLKRGSNF